MSAWRSSRCTSAVRPVPLTCHGTNPPDLAPHPEQFVKLVEAEVAEKAVPVLLICRSGKRTLDAGLALEAAGYTDVYNVLHGFEGELNDQFHRSMVNGWRFDGLPWEQL